MEQDKGKWKVVALGETHVLQFSEVSIMAPVLMQEFDMPGMANAYAQGKATVSSEHKLGARYTWVVQDPTGKIEAAYRYIDAMDI